MAAFKAETRAVLVRWFEASTQPDAPIRDRHVGSVVGDMTETLRRHHVHVDLDTLLFWRAAIALDSSALSLAPEFDLVREMREYFQKVRPSVPARVVAAALDPDRWFHVGAIVLESAGAVRRVLAAGHDGERAWTVITEESLAERRSGNREARACAIALCTLSVVIVASRVTEPAIVLQVASAVAFYRLLSGIRAGRR